MWNRPPTASGQKLSHGLCRHRHRAPSIFIGCSSRRLVPFIFAKRHRTQDYDLKADLDLSRQRYARRASTVLSHAESEHSGTFRQKQIERSGFRKDQASFEPRIRAISASSEKIPGPNIRMMMAVSMN